jgi:hypothetical protein
VDLSWYREQIEAQYKDTENGADFGVALCHEIHANGMTFIWLAEKWGVSLTMLGLLIADHCARLEAKPKVNFDYKAGDA